MRRVQDVTERIHGAETGKIGTNDRCETTGTITRRAEQSTTHTRRETQPQYPGLHGSRMLFIEGKSKALTNDLPCSMVSVSCVFPQDQVAYRARRDRSSADVGAEGNQIRRYSPNFYKLLLLNMAGRI
jgi:hypothetical protein